MVVVCCSACGCHEQPGEEATQSEGDAAGAAGPHPGGAAHRGGDDGGGGGRGTARPAPRHQEVPGVCRDPSDRAQPDPQTEHHTPGRWTIRRTGITFFYCTTLANLFLVMNG